MPVVGMVRVAAEDAGEIGADLVERFLLNERQSCRAGADRRS